MCSLPVSTYTANRGGFRLIYGAYFGGGICFSCTEKIIRVHQITAVLRKTLNKLMSLCHCLPKQLGYINWRISSTKSALHSTAAMHKSQASGDLGDNIFLWVYVYLYTYRVERTGSTKVDRSRQNCGSSVWNLLRVTLLVHRIWWLPVHFRKICWPLVYHST